MPCDITIYCKRFYKKTVESDIEEHEGTVDRCTKELISLASLTPTTPKDCEGNEYPVQEALVITVEELVEQIRGAVMQLALLYEVQTSEKYEPETITWEEE